LTDSEKDAAYSKAVKPLEDYFSANYGLANIQNAFRRVRLWAARHKVDPSRIIVGEFGVTRTVGPYAGADADSAQRWLSAVRREAERNSFAWSLWQYSCPAGMTLANEYPAKTLDSGVLRALGLAQPASAR
jgi:hypothetical protein